MVLRRIVALTAAIVALASGPVAAQATKLTVAYVPAGDLVIAFVAKDRGFFDRHGLDVTLLKMPIASNIAPALVSSSIDIGMGTATTLVQSAASGLDFVAIQGISRFLAANPKMSLVARTGSGIRTAQDLPGHRVGVPGINSVADVGLRAWLLDRHVPLDRVIFVEANSPQMKDLLASASLDAVAALEPFRSRIIESGTGTRVADFYSELNPSAVSAVWMTTRPWAEAHRPAVAAFRAAMEDAAQLLAVDSAVRNPLEIKYLGYPSPVPPSISLGIEPKDFDFYVRIMTRLGLIDRSVDVNSLVFGN